MAVCICVYVYAFVCVYMFTYVCMCDLYKEMKMNPSRYSTITSYSIKQATGHSESAPTFAFFLEPSLLDASFWPVVLSIQISPRVWKCILRMGVAALCIIFSISRYILLKVRELSVCLRMGRRQLLLKTFRV